MTDKVCVGHATNLQTIVRAAREEALCLIECERVSDGKVVAVLCAVNVEDDGVHEMVPFAEMASGDPYEQWRPPAPDGTGFLVQ